MRRLLPILTALAYVGGLAACNSPSTPSSANVAGNWAGTVSFSLAAGPATQAVTMSLTQNGSAVSGTWQTTNGTAPKNGTVTGTTTATTFSGTFTVTIVNNVTDTTCSGSLTVSGDAGGATLTWTSPGVTGGCSVDPPTDVTFSISKQ